MFLQDTRDFPLLNNILQLFTELNFNRTYKTFQAYLKVKEKYSIYIIITKTEQMLTYCSLFQIIFLKKYVYRHC